VIHQREAVLLGHVLLEHLEGREVKLHDLAAADAYEVVVVLTPPDVLVGPAAIRRIDGAPYDPGFHHQWQVPIDRGDGDANALREGFHDEMTPRTATTSQYFGALSREPHSLLRNDPSKTAHTTSFQRADRAVNDRFLLHSIRNNRVIRAEQAVASLDRDLPGPLHTIMVTREVDPDGIVEPFEIIAIAVALAMDAFAVSVAVGLLLGRVTARQTFRLAWHFGLFQALMPIVGWIGGLTVRPWIECFDHWVAFALLAFVGGKMLLEAYRGDRERGEGVDPTRGWSLVVLAVATSIDALAVGLSLAMVQVSIWFPALIIGLVAAGFTAVGVHLGRLVGSVDQLARGSCALGGLVLIAIGLRILWEHRALSMLLSG